MKNKHENHVVINYVCKFFLFPTFKKELNLILNRKPSDCHHSEREPHLCHFNECPSCKQQCNLSLKDCSHLCSAICHDSVLIKEEINSSNTPWGIKEKEKVDKKIFTLSTMSSSNNSFLFWSTYCMNRNFL